jgi:hypothetical protein
MNLFAWWGVFGPPAMPRSVTRKLDSEVRLAMQAPDFKARLRSLELQESLCRRKSNAGFIEAETRILAGSFCSEPGSDSILNTPSSEGNSRAKRSN